MVRTLNVLRLAPIGFVVAIAALSALGLTGAWAVAQNATTLGVILWMLPSVVVGALLTVYGTALLQGALSGSDVDVERVAIWRQAWMLLLVFAIFTVTVSIAGFLYVRDLEVTVRRQRLDEQLAIASLKAQAIEKWLVERWLDIQWLARSISYLPLASPDLERSDRALIEVLFAELLAGSSQRVMVCLYAADGRLVAHAGEPVGPEEAIAFARRTAEAGDPARPRIDQLRTPAGAMRLDFVQPITAAGANAPLAWLVVRADPDISLLPEVQRWPIASATSEVTLVRREGNEAAFVMPPLRLPADRRAPAAIPLSEAGVIAVRAVLEGDGVREGLDYRRVPVLAAVKRVAGIDWYVIAKTDVAEALTPIDRRARLVVWLTAGAILVAAATTLGLWHVDRTGYAALRERHERERQALTRHYEQMMKRARDFIFLFDDERRIVDANDAAVAAYGYSVDEFRNMNLTDLRVERLRSRHAADWAAMLATGVPFETIHRRKDGGEFPVEVLAGTFIMEGRTYLQAFVRDVSVRKQLEAELARLARVQTALRAAAGVLMRAQSEKDLYQGICDALVEIGGYRLVDIALANDDAGKTVSFAAIAGHDDGYLDQTRISWGEGARSRGPTGAAIRTGEVQVNQDFASNAAMAPWRDEALRHGLQSSVGLPLSTGGRVFGALTLYAEQPDAFDREEVAFLVQFAADISYGVGNLRRQKQ
jgi:PAS domain S-box-containing protein